MGANLETVRKRGDQPIPNSHAINMCLELTQYTPETANYLYDSLKNIISSNKKLSANEAVNSVLDFVERHKEHVTILGMDTGDAWTGQQPKDPLAILNLKLMDEANQNLPEMTVELHCAVNDGAYVRSWLEGSEKVAAPAAGVPTADAAGASAAGGGAHG